MGRHQALVLVILSLLVFNAILVAISVSLAGNGKGYYVLVQCRDDSSGLERNLTVIHLYEPVTANLSFIHSVHKTPIYDILEVNSTGFYGVEHWTMEFGAGEPDTAEDAGASSWIYNESTGFYIFRGMHRPLGKTLYLPLDVSINMSITFYTGDHKLVFNDRICSRMLVLEVIGAKDK
ncbi:MAG: DUF1850 domain-containing protein [Desulfurococcales archaeon]|nr:DUF1850 domain-containing protein [Desulfurococcales archaeon]